MNLVTKTLVIIPCGRAKVWERHPDHGPCPARDAYIGYPFRVNREYAELFGDAWVVLSARYGFLRPDDEVAEPYDVTFGQRSPQLVTKDQLSRQISELRLDEYATVIVLGGKHYREAATRAFCDTQQQFLFPFAGLGLGKSIQATRRAIESGTAIPSCAPA